jgi:hypothetical protein
MGDLGLKMSRRRKETVIKALNRWIWEKMFKNRYQFLERKRQCEGLKEKKEWQNRNADNIETVQERNTR